MYEFSGRNVLVTGGSRGIGRAIAMAFAERGARVALNYRRDDRRAEETLAELAGEGHVLLRADLSQPGVPGDLIGCAVASLGGLHILVNNAGGWQRHPLATTEFAAWRHAWDWILETNLRAPADLSYHAARHMMAEGGGRIVNVSSRGAFRGEPDGPAYAASKAGLNALSQSLAKSLAPHGIFVGVVAPGFVETEMARDYLTGPSGDEIRAQSPLGRVARPEEVAHAVLFLASEGAEFSTGTIIDVNGASYLRS